MYSYMYHFARVNNCSALHFSVLVHLQEHLRPHATALKHRVGLDDGYYAEPGLVVVHSWS